MTQEGFHDWSLKAAPDELKAMVSGCRRTAEEVLDIIGDWAVCEDAKGVF